MKRLTTRQRLQVADATIQGLNSFGAHFLVECWGVRDPNTRMMPDLPPVIVMHDPDDHDNTSITNMVEVVAVEMGLPLLKTAYPGINWNPEALEQVIWVEHTEYKRQPGLFSTEWSRVTFGDYRINLTWESVRGFTRQSFTGTNWSALTADEAKALIESGV